MAFWIIIPLMTLLAVSFVTIPLLRKRAAAPIVSPDVDSPAGVTTVNESAPSPPKAGSRTGGARTVPWLVLGLGLVVAIPSVGLYAFVGRPDLAAVRAPGNNTPAAQGGDGAQAPSMAQMIADLEVKTKQAPNDADAWQTLGWAYMHISRFDDAVGAYKHAVSLDPSNSESLSALTEATVQANGGKISPAAVAGFRRVTAATPIDPRARFYLALYKDQQGDHRGAVADWVKLLKEAPADSPWASEVRGVVETVAHEQGIDIPAQLPPAPPSEKPESSAIPGPSAEQVAAAQQMSGSDQNAMIHTMVDKLATQLKQNPQDADGWLRLIRARMVLGEKSQALAAYHSARSAFVQDPAQLTALDKAAHALGVAGG